MQTAPLDVVRTILSYMDPVSKCMLRMTCKRFGELKLSIDLKTRRTLNVASDYGYYDIIKLYYPIMDVNPWPIIEKICRYENQDMIHFILMTLRNQTDTVVHKGYDNTDEELEYIIEYLVEYNKLETIIHINKMYGLNERLLQRIHTLSLQLRKKEIYDWKTGEYHTDDDFERRCRGHWHPRHFRPN